MPHPLVSTSPFGVVPGVGRASLFTLSSPSGVTASFTDYGATLVGWRVPDRAGKFADIVPGFESAGDYAHHTAYFGATCGRVANRIGRGVFHLAGKTHKLAVNNGPNHLHGGIVGFDRHLWTATVAGAPDAPSVTFSRRSPDGEEGYPGNLDAAVTCTLEPDGALRLDFRASADAPTIVNLVNHAYFNLAGHDRGDCLGHFLKIPSAHFLPCDEHGLPTGEIARTEGTPFDFLAARRLGERIGDDDAQLRFGRGYDHGFVVPGTPDELRPAAELSYPENGRTLAVLTTCPDIHLYTGNWIAECVGDIRGKSGARYGGRAGVCLEAQHFPNSANLPQFPGVALFPGAVRATTTVYRPSVI